MHWIEELLNVDPDGGSGVTEAAMLVAVGAGVLLASLRVRAGATRRRVRRGR